MSQYSTLPIVEASSAKRAAARTALAWVEPGCVLGIGSGSTVAMFIEELAAAGARLDRAVSTSSATDALLREIGVAVVELGEVSGTLGVYVDGADEVDALGRGIKGGGGAHTREKRVANASATWVCIVDDTKVVAHLGVRTAVPLEVEAGSLDSVTRTLESWGARSRFREGWAADSRHVLLDVTGLDLSDPQAAESRLDSIPGVVACGIFAHRRADVVIIGHADGSASTLHPGTEETDR